MPSSLNQVCRNRDTEKRHNWSMLEKHESKMRRDLARKQNKERPMHRPFSQCSFSFSNHEFG
jgi:hypothetical protein